MSVKFEKTGIVMADGLGVNPNLLTEPYWSYSSSKWSYHTTGPSSSTIKPVLQPNGDVIFTGPGTQTGDQCYMHNQSSTQQFSLTAGNTYTISVKLTAHGAGYWRFYWYDKDSSGSNLYGGSKEFEFADGETKTVSWTRTISANTVKCYWELNMVRSAATSTITMYAHSLKLEEGEVPTPWCPNETDDIYTGTAVGFTESDEKPSIGKAGYVQATEFIEW